MASRTLLSPAAVQTDSDSSGEGLLTGEEEGWARRDVFTDDAGDEDDDDDDEEELFKKGLRLTG